MLVALPSLSVVLLSSVLVVLRLVSLMPRRLAFRSALTSSADASAVSKREVVVAVALAVVLVALAAMLVVSIVVSASYVLSLTRLVSLLRGRPVLRSALLVSRSVVKPCATGEFAGAEMAALVVLAV